MADDYIAVPISYHTHALLLNESYRCACGQIAKYALDDVAMCVSCYVADGNIPQPASVWDWARRRHLSHHAISIAPPMHPDAAPKA